MREKTSILTGSSYMKTRTIAILAATAFLLVGGMFVVAQRVMQKGLHGRGYGPGMIFRQLNLTDDQKAKIKDILEANKGAIQPIRDAMKANHEKLASLNGNFDEAQVSAIAKEQGDLTAQMIVARERVRSQIFAILTDEQKAKATQIHDQMKARFQERMKPWGNKPGAGKGADDEE
jgi:periplasmic protein CpxP/Spy